MNRTLLSVLLGLLALVLGLLAPLVSFIAAALVEIPGQNPPQEVVAACAGAAVFLYICQFLVARPHRAASARWLTAALMFAPLCYFVVNGVDPRRWIVVLVAGGLASVAAVLLALRSAPAAT